LRLVLDTNVIVSALLLHNSPSRKVFDLAFEKGKVLVSLAALAEAYEVLNRPKFRKYVSKEATRLFLVGFVRKAEWVEVTENIQVGQDPKDNKILELAVNGHATHIVTGDRDLISLSPFRGIPVVPPAVILRELE